MTVPQTTPTSRIRLLWDHPPRNDGHYVLYWMTSARRTRWNFGLDRAIELAVSLGRPLLVLEALRADYPWASDRFHQFVVHGMRANREVFEGNNVRYYPYVEPSIGAGKGLLQALAKSACAVVTDDSPAFFLPAMLASARLDVSVRFEAVDSNGLLPLRATDRCFSRAYDFRRFLQGELRQHLSISPRKSAFPRTALPRLTRIPKEVSLRWPEVDPELLENPTRLLGELSIDHSVAPVPFEGGEKAGEKVLQRFLEQRLDGYGGGRNSIEVDNTSGLSPYLHFGHISPHQVFAQVAAKEQWSQEKLGNDKKGKREGWWGMGEAAEAFLDQLVTWRELGLNAAVHQVGYDRFESLPKWALTTLEEHAADERPSVYTLEEFEQSATHDDLWNAAQAQLRSQGLIHGYLRMLWGKKILHWSSSPREAYEIMVALNNKFAIDGRDPNSTSGILWILGKFDRAWGPERPVFGKVRYMTSDNTRRKLRVGEYLRRWS
ncbi:MAG: deoxyribodipyrimidine photo-lyase [Planctomycetota bacterium]|jgi:deoxyribodipyrimidine photo-lyase